MIELVLVYCLSDVPDRCVERREALSENITPMQCTIDAQQRAQVYGEPPPVPAGSLALRGRQAEGAAGLTGCFR
jgi:hypothetical protein